MSSIPESKGKALMRILENGNIEALKKIMTKDVVYVASQQGHSYKGIEEVSSYVEHVKLFTKDLKIDIVSVISAETTASIE